MSIPSRVALELPSRAFARRRPGSVSDGLLANKARIPERLAAFPLFDGLAPASLSKLASATRAQRYAAGDVIWRQDEPSRHVLFIEEGLVISSRIVQGGVNRTYGLYGPGDSLGIYAIWAGMKYPTDALALNHGLSALLLSATALVEMARQEPLLFEPLMAEIGHFTESFIRKIDIVSAGAVPCRVASLMLQLLERYGVDTDADAARLPIRLTLEQIGAITDARIETVARAMAAWKREGWMSNDSDGFQFSNLESLRRQAHG